MRLKILCFFVLLSLTWGPGQADDLLKINPVKDEMKRYFVKRIEVFGLQVFATQSCPNDKMRHAARVLAEYLDNNEDGLADNPIVLERMKKQRAAMAHHRKPCLTRLTPAASKPLKNKPFSITYSNGFKGF